MAVEDPDPGHAAKGQWHLQWREVSVADRPAVYGVAGDGPAVLFLHGWGLAHRTYRRALKRVVAAHLRVFAPALPGFGGTAGLPDAELTLAGYAAWVDGFCAAVGITEPVVVVGHSFGGGVAIRLAHDFPERVGRLVLVNSIGGATWSRAGGIVRSLRERPLWDWGLHLQADLLPLRHLSRVLPVIAEDALPNLVRNPAAIWRVAHLARTADLTAELEDLKRRRLPVVILWGEQDGVLPAPCLESLRTALGDPQCITVPGNHSWLLADPAAFAEVITNVIGVARVADSLRPEG